MVDASVEVTKDRVLDLKNGTAQPNTGRLFLLANLLVCHYSAKASGGGLAGTIADVRSATKPHRNGECHCDAMVRRTTVEVNEQAAAVDNDRVIFLILRDKADSGSSYCPPSNGRRQFLLVQNARRGIKRRSWRGELVFVSLAQVLPRTNNFTVEGVNNNAQIGYCSVGHGSE